MAYTRVDATSAECKDQGESSSSPSLLDRGTQLVAAVIYPGAGEAVLVPRPGSVDRARTRADALQRAVEGIAERAAVGRDADQGGGDGKREDNRERAARRARGKVRRYAVANRCDRLWSLTCADQTHDRGTMVARLRAFLRKINAAYPSLAWVWVIERHKSGALHAHLVTSQYVPRDRVASLWGHGFVDVRRIRAPKGREGGRANARTAARYVAKYVAKDPVRDQGEHAYEVRQGLQPETLRLAESSFWAAYKAACGAFGGEVPSYTWESQTVTGWTGPPVVFMGWS